MPTAARALPYRAWVGSSVSEYFVRSVVDEGAIRQADNDDPLCSGLYEFYRKTLRGIGNKGIEDYVDQVQRKKSQGAAREAALPVHVNDDMFERNYGPMKQESYYFSRTMEDQGRIVRQIVACSSEVEEQDVNYVCVVVISEVRCVVDGEPCFSLP